MQMFLGTSVLVKIRGEQTVAVDVGVVTVGVPVAQPPAGPMRTPQAPRPVMSPDILSVTVRTQVPSAPCPSNTDSGFAGRYTPPTEAGQAIVPNASSSNVIPGKLPHCPLTTVTVVPAGF